MGRPKCILGCSEFTALYQFPHVCPKRMQLWANNLGIDVKLIRKIHRICKLHFNPKHVGKRYLLLDAVPEKRITSKSTPHPNTDETTYETEYISNDGRFETIYLTPKTKPARTHGGQPPKTLPPQVHEPADDATTQATTDENYTQELSGSDIEPSDECTLVLEPVDTAFKSPPKRTYGHSNNNNNNSLPPKTPKLDITATCYCRCHKGEDEKIRLKRTIDEMKLTISDQAREINLLISKNKLSEHLLKGKVKKISDLMNHENSLRKAIEGLNVRISIMSKRQIKAASNASENSIILARMICDKRKRYTKSEVIVANKLYAISGRCYYFMRDVLKLNLPHPTTLLRNRNIFSPVADEHAIYKDFDGEPMDQMLEEQEPIVFSPEPVMEQHEEDALLLNVDI